jgi:hypothetical protein
MYASIPDKLKELQDALLLLIKDFETPDAIRYQAETVLRECETLGRMDASILGIRRNRIEP